VDSMIQRNTSRENNPVYKVGCVDENLLADVVHKIKNGLGGIGGFATLLERDLEADDPRKRLAIRIQDGVQKVNEVVVSLMTLVRMPKPQFKEVNLATILRSDIFRNQYGCTEIEMPFHSELAKGELRIQADEDMIEKMLMHVVQFTQFYGNGVQAIQMNCKKNFIDLEFHFLKTMSISNELEGIDQFLNDVQPIGARMSLSIILEIVKLHGGKVMINSCADDRMILLIQLRKGR